MTTKHFIIIVYLLVLVPVYSWSQQYTETKLFERLQAISENDYDYYNIDGITISCQVTNILFSKENICSNLSLSDSMLSKSSPFITQKNYTFEKVDTISNKYYQYNTNFFIQNEKGHIVHIIYMSPNKRCSELQRKLTQLIIDRKIPETVFNKKFFHTISFAGRKVDLETYACRWANVNSVQCPYHGQMSWSVHADSSDARQTLELQRYVTAHADYKNFKAIADETIDIIFEGQHIKAQRITYQPEKELGALLLNTGGGNTQALIIYYVMAPVRGYYVSCVMSHWNNDLIEADSKLPSLLEKVMKLK